MWCVVCADSRVEGSVSVQHRDSFPPCSHGSPVTGHLTELLTREEVREVREVMEEVRDDSILGSVINTEMTEG